MTFWSRFPPALCLPDNCDCEYVRDALIAQPSAFWSSLSYLIAAMVLYRIIPRKTMTLKLWTFSFLLLGLCSHFAHASFIQFALAMDFAGIVLIMSFFFLMKWISKRTQNILVVGIVLLLYLSGLAWIFYSLEKWFQVGISLGVFALAIIEIVLAESKEFWKAREMRLSLLILLGSFVLFLLDELKIVCDPMSWLQGHSFWHIGTSVSIFLYGKWRFREERYMVQP